MKPLDNTGFNLLNI